MNEVLTQDEIDQLLNSINKDNGRSMDDDSVPSKKQHIRIYDFNRPDFISKDSLRDLSKMYEMFARVLSKELAARKKKRIHVHLVSIDQLTYEEFIRSIPTPTLLWKMNARGLHHPVTAELEPYYFRPLFPLPEITDEKQKQKLTGKEIKRMMPDLKFITKVFRRSWNSRLPAKNFHAAGVEINPAFVNAAGPFDMGVLLSFEIKVEEKEGFFNIFLPAAMFGTNWHFSEMIKRLSTEETSINGSAEEEEKNMSEKIDSIKTKVVVVLGGTELSIEELKNAKEGGIIVLDKPAGEPLDIYAGGTLFAKGETIVVDDEFGIRITKVL